MMSTPPAGEIGLRPARLTDAAPIKAILQATFESTWGPQITAEAARAFRGQDRPGAYFAQSGLEFWVAERQGEVVGFVHWRGDFVHALHVHPSQARRGVGSALMDHAEAAIASAGHRQVRLETDTFNTRSRAFYAARGYAEIDSYPDTEWKSGLTTLLLVKTLG